jgi:hypothetical protein
MTAISQRDRAISYIKDKMAACFDQQEIERASQSEGLLTLLEGLSDEEYLQAFCFCSCCSEESQERSEPCHHLM